MLDLEQFHNVKLPGGFTIKKLEESAKGLVDAIGRTALARTRITGGSIEMMISPAMGEVEQSVSIYHEILEAMTVASETPPSGVREFVESDFEREAYLAHEKLGSASPQNLLRMLHSFGFGE